MYEVGTALMPARGFCRCSAGNVLLLVHVRSPITQAPRPQDCTLRTAFTGGSLQGLQRMREGGEAPVSGLKTRGWPAWT